MVPLVRAEGRAFEYPLTGYTSARNLAHAPKRRRCSWPQPWHWPRTHSRHCMPLPRGVPSTSRAPARLARSIILACSATATRCCYARGTVETNAARDLLFVCAVVEPLPTGLLRGLSRHSTLTFSVTPSPSAPPLSQTMDLTYLPLCVVLH